MKLKKLLRLPARLKKRIALSKSIENFDRVADSHRQHSKYILENGWLKTTIDKILESPGISERMRHSELRQKPSINKQVYYSWSIPDFVWQAILNSKTILDITKDYLGPDARLDDLYIKTVVDGLQSGAEGWHDDNVGYRLKVFMVFDTEGTPSDTLLIPHSRPNPYKVKIKEEIKRMIGKPDTRQRDREVRVEYKPGDCLIFDTNLLHRGDYSTSSGIRYCLVAEFIDRKKADFLKDSSPCGPGQSAMQIKIPFLPTQKISENPLIDQEILEPHADHYKYGYKQTKKYPKNLP